MSLQDVKVTTQACLTDIYSALDEQGATIPEQKNLTNVAPAIRSIVGGVGSNIPTIAMLEYIQVPGTQYIDTGVKPNSNTRFEISVEIEPQTSKTDMCLFGSRTASGGGDQNQFVLWDGYNTDDVSHRTIPVIGSLSSEYYFFPPLTKNIFKYDGTSFYCNGEKIFEMVNSISQTNFTIFLFTVNSGGTANDRRYKGKFYYFKIWEGDTLIRDFVPALLNGEPCLFDNVTKYYYENKGTGSFVAGPIKEE